jgi:transcriptional regulator
MYIPEHFRVRSHAAALAFMRENPFVVLVSTVENAPFASHVPVVLRESGEQLFVRGHFAKANPHWRYLEQQPQCLTIFHGPHSYISPTLYTNVESVPTWNYGAIHVYGNARLYSSPEDLQIVLHELMGVFEPSYAAQWAGLDDDYRERMLRQIVGFEIAVTKIEGKFKLGQNRTKEDQANMIAALGKAEDTAISGVARLMLEQGMGSCPVKISGKESK